MQPRVALIILCYNGVQDTLACLRSLELLDYPRDRLEIVVIDNASSDGTVEAIRTGYPRATVIETGANLGYAAGNNVGLRYALERGHDYALLLNNDTEVAPDFVRVMVDVLEADPAIGVAGPTIYYYDIPDMIWSAGGLIDWRRGTSAMRGIGEIDHHQYDTVTDVDFVTGCALLCKRSVLESAGLLDERFFMYYEETEWCVRVRKAGFDIVYVPAAHVWHKIPFDARADKPYVAYYMTRNRLLFLHTTGATFVTWVHALLLQDLRTYLSQSLHPKWRAKKAHRAALLCGWIDFWRGHFGHSSRV